MYKEIQKIIEQYIETFPEEKDRLTLVTEQFPFGADITSRKNLPGHVTVSAVIFSPHKKDILLIYHKQLQRFLQPGGHIEEFDKSLLDACLREVREETGLRNIEPFDRTANQMPIDIDIHSIPANEKKNELEHFHCDLCFVFVSKSSEIEIQEEEIESYKWTSLGDAMRNKRLGGIIKKVHSLSHRSDPTIFLHSLSDFSHRDISFLVVTHLLQDRPYFLEALSDLGYIEGIIPKPNSINGKVLEEIQDRFPILSLTKESLYNIDSLSPLIEKSKQRIILLDIGGYFSHIINALNERFPGKIIGIVEDTENGYQKYMSLPHLSVPVFSVARSILKENEDFLVGESVVFSTDSVLREYNILFDYMHCGVIGYGKIGRSIVSNLQKRNIRISVYDQRATRGIEAINNGCHFTDKMSLLKRSEILFCATGNQSLSREDFIHLRNGTFVVSVTSSDDEMDLSILDQIYTRQDMTDHITKYHNSDNYFYLINKGNAVNFIHGAVVGSFIFLVQAEILLCIKQLCTQEYKGGMYELQSEIREDIAEKWLRVFNKTSE